jgi:hypothetical protein
MYNLKIPNNATTFGISQQANFIYCPQCKQAHPIIFWKDSSKYCNECEESHECLVCPNDHKFNYMEDMLSGGYNPTLQIHLITIMNAMDSLEEFLGKESLIKDIGDEE